MLIQLRFSIAKKVARSALFSASAMNCYQLCGSGTSPWSTILRIGRVLYPLAFS